MPLIIHVFYENLEFFFENFENFSIFIFFGKYLNFMQILNKGNSKITEPRTI